MKGLHWMHRFLTKNHCEALVGIGDDAACIFFEIWYTSASSTIRSTAKSIAIDLLDKYERHLLEPDRCKCKLCSQGHRVQPDDKDLFFQLMYLVRCRDEMELDAEKMLKAADELWLANGLSDTDKLFGVTVEDLPSVSDGDWVVLIMNIMIMEFNQILFPRRWPLHWGMRQAFDYLRTHTYHGPPYEADFKFHDSFYLVTHIAFAISAYSAIKTSTKDAPWLYDYNRRACKYWVKMADQRISGRHSDRLVDIDGLAEAMDVMRCCGLTDGGDRLLCSAALALLALQRPDGSWPFLCLADDNQGCLVAQEPKESSFYNLVHPTWVAVQSLRDRHFDYERKAGG
jgi:hypothetical protein